MASVTTHVLSHDNCLSIIMAGETTHITHTHTHEHTLGRFDSLSLLAMYVLPAYLLVTQILSEAHACACLCGCADAHSSRSFVVWCAHTHTYVHCEMRIIVDLGSAHSPPNQPKQS